MSGVMVSTGTARMNILENIAIHTNAKTKAQTGICTCQTSIHTTPKTNMLTVRFGVSALR